ncbi:MFS transporter, partial [Colletotrichum musicola]
AWFLSQRERLVAVKRVSDNETGIKNKAFDKKQGLVGFFDPKTLLLFTSVFAAAIPNGVVNSFSTVIIRDMGFDTTKTTQLKSVGDAVQIVALRIGGTVILNVPNLFNTAYCWGNFAGPFVVKPSEAPHFRGATIGLLVGYAIKFVCHLSLLFYMFFVNRYRYNKYGEPDRERRKEAGMGDQTEFENKDFRYVL